MGEDDPGMLTAQAIDLRQRHFDSVVLRNRVLACGQRCVELLVVADDAIRNYSDALAELQEFGLLNYAFYLDWCCATGNASGATGCQAPTGFDGTCLGVCWTCHEGWTNEDGSFGCVGAETNECPK